MANIFYSSLNDIISSLTQNEENEDIKKEFEAVKTTVKDYLNSKNSLNFDNETTQSLLMLKDMKDSEYSKSLGFFIENFKDLPRQISDLRSNYIPVESINSYNTRFNLGAANAFGEATEVSDDFALKESFENAFMRILGMPESNDINDDEDIYILDPETLKIKSVKVSSLYNPDPPITSSNNGLDILDERQRTLSSRFLTFSGHTTDKVLSDLIEEANKNLNTTSTEQKTEGKNVDTQKPKKITIKDINLNFQKISNLFYLKALPVQDSRFLKCISESEKIVSKPFDDRFVKTVNKEKIKTSFLENLIRLRLDKISGQIYSDENISDTTGKKDKSTSATNKNALNQFSILEQYLFENLLDTLSSLASNYSASINDIISNAKKIKQQDDEAKAKAKEAVKAQENAAGDSDGNDNPKPPQDDSKTENPEMLKLQEIVALHESILLVLRDTSISSSLSSLANSTQISPSLYSGYIRNTSGYDDAISNSIIALVESEASIFRDRLDSLAKPSLDDTTRDPSGGSVVAEVGDTIVGSDTIPIGIVDIIVYVLALFSLNETSLINLLTQKQKEKLAKLISPNGSVNQLFSSEEFNLTSPVSSINELTIALSIYYKFFINRMSSESQDIIIAQIGSDVAKDSEATSVNDDGSTGEEDLED